MTNEEALQEHEQILRELPINLSAEQLADFMGISLSSAYNLANTPDFPRLRTPGHRLIIIPRHKFIAWYNDNCVTARELKQRHA